MKQDKQPTSTRTDNEPSSKPGRASRADNVAAQRHQKESQAAQLAAANVEESPYMDRGNSAGGAGQSLPEGETQQGASPQPRGAVDTQYGTRSGLKTSKGAQPNTSSTATSPPSVPNPGSSEKSSGTDRDTMSGPRPGSDS